MTRVAQQHAPIEAKAAGLGAFPSLTRPNVLWIGVVAPSLAALQRDVEGALVDLGLDPEERAFHPHVTVGRVKESRPGQSDLTALWSGDVDCGSSPLSEIIVYESKTRSSGAEYIARARVPLGRLQKEQG